MERIGCLTSFTPSAEKKILPFSSPPTFWIRFRGFVTEVGIMIKGDLVAMGPIEELAKRTLREFGAIDILVNNAGINSPGEVINITIKRWDLVIAVNLRGTFLCTKAVLPTMVKRRSGCIINVSSVVGTREIAFGVAYGVTKAAIERFTRGLAEELKEYNIAVNALCPDFTVTEAVKTYFPHADTKGWQLPEMWGKYVVLLAAQQAESLTGRILDESALKEIFGPV
jgi:NAD(P)-dependent dehydrogenase (short-subunit alcohol dehydrogenase family)